MSRKRCSTNNKTSRCLKTGWGEADITPDGRIVELVGQYYQRLATGVFSRLKTTVLILEQDGDISAMVSLDVLDLPSDFSRTLQERIAAAVPGLAPERVLIHAIHTHNAPGLDICFNWWTPEPGAIKPEEYREFVAEKATAAARAAWGSLKETGIACALGFARVGHCRRSVYTDGTAEMYGDTGREDFAGMEGGEDSGVELMFLADRDRQLVGVVLNVACPSQVMEATYKISSDFMGVLREKLREEFGSDFMLLPQIGASGCQSPRDLSRNYCNEPDFWHEENVHVVSDRLLETVRDCWSRICDKFDFSPLLRHSTRTIRLPKRRATYGEYIVAKREMEQLESTQSSHDAFKEFCDEVHANEKIPGRPGPYDDKKRHFVQIRNREAVVRRYEEQNLAPDIPVEVHVVRLGDAVFVSNPFELFLEFGQRIKARSPAGQTFVVQLANGCEGYLPSSRAEQLGGYGGLIINGTVGSEGGSKLVDYSIEEITALWGSHD